MSLKIHAITSEVVLNAFQSITEEMSVALVRSAYSTNIKERKDCSCAIFDSKGSLITLAENIPIHLGSMQGLMNKIGRNLKKWSFHRGDILIANDPHLGGGSHLPDVTLTKPVYYHNKLVAFVLSGDHFNIDDITKVWVENNKVEKIGKNIDRFNGVDAGIFLYSSIVFDALEKNIAQGKYSLLAANQMLSNMGRLKTIDISDNFWIDVDHKKALKKTKKMLIKQLKKPEDDAIPRYLYRKISVLISSRLSHFNIHPNHITLISFFLATLSGLFFFLGGYPKIVIGAFIAQLSWIFDLCDGEIARLKFKESKFGEFLDRVLDRYADALIILGIIFACFQSMKTTWVWLVGFFALIGSFMNSYTALDYDKFIASKAFIKKRTIRMGREIRLLIVFIGAVLNQLFALLLVLSIVTNAVSIRRLFMLRNEYKSS